MEQNDFENTVRAVIEKHGFFLTQKEVAHMLRRSEGGFRYSMCRSNLPFYEELRSVRVRVGRRCSYPTLPTIRIILGGDR